MPVKFAGHKVKLGDAEFEIPSLSLGQIKRLSGEVALMSRLQPNSPMTPELMETFITVVHAAMSRNYPDVGREWLEDNIDLANVMDVVNAVMNVSGFIRNKNAAVGEQESQLTGTGSTVTS